MKWEKFNQELQDFVRVSVDNKTKKILQNNYIWYNL